MRMRGIEQEAEKASQTTMPKFSKFVLTDYEQRVFRILYQNEKALSTFEIYRHLVSDLVIDFMRSKNPVLKQKTVRIDENKILDVDGVFRDLKSDMGDGRVFLSSSKSEFDSQLMKITQLCPMPRYGMIDRILDEAAAAGWIKTRPGSGKVKMLYFLDAEMRQKVKTELLTKSIS